MAEDDLVKLIRWLHAEQKPHYALLPKSNIWRNGKPVDCRNCGGGGRFRGQCGGARGQCSVFSIQRSTAPQTWSALILPANKSAFFAGFLNTTANSLSEAPL